MRLKSNKGAAVVELAILLPLLLVLIFGLIEFGFLWLQNHYISNSAREGARVAAQDFASSTERDTAVNDAVIAYLKELYPDSLFEDGTGFVTVTIDPTYTITTVTPALAANKVTVTVNTGDFRLPTLITDFSRMALPGEITAPTEITEAAIYPMNTQP